VVALLLSTSSLRWASLVPLLLTSLAVMGSPGPATISLTASGVAFGVRRSARYLAGIIAGTAIVLLAVAVGLTGALLAVPGLRPVLLAVSIAYVLYLAFHIATAPPLDAAASDAQAGSFPGGLLLGVANPKAWVAIAAVFASVEVADGALADALAKVAALSAMVVVINGGWLVAGASLAPVLRDPRRSRVANVLLAVALVVATGAAVTGL
jgi:threonine/homoserine/homoserine lactone efflux protein